MKSFSTPPLIQIPGSDFPARAAGHRAEAARLRQEASTLRAASAEDEQADDPTPAVAEALAGRLDAAAAFHEGKAAELEGMTAGNWRRWP